MRQPRRYKPSNQRSPSANLLTLRPSINGYLRLADGWWDYLRCADVRAALIRGSGRKALMSGAQQEVGGA